MGEGDGVGLDLAFDVGDAAGGVPGLAAVRTAAQQDMLRAPVALGTLASFGEGHHRALRRDGDGGDPVVGITAGFGFEDVDLFEKRRPLDGRVGRAGEGQGGKQSDNKNGSGAVGQGAATCAGDSVAREAHEIGTSPWG